MKVSTKFLKSTMTLVGIFAVQFASAQCPAISCPGNQTVNNTPGICGAVVTYVTPVGTNPCGGGGTTFNYTGGMQTYTVPAGVTSIIVDMSGGEGGLSYYVPNGGPGGHISGLGGRVQATYAVTPGQVYNIFVGQKGVSGTTVGGAGGYNGGGTAGTYGGNQGGGGGGGGASDIRFGGVGLANRKFVAGGGGGAGYNNGSGEDGGNGGGLIGLNGEVANNPNDVGSGKGGTQLAGGAFGQFPGWPGGTNGVLGVGGDGAPTTLGGGGGGGYYGGGGGSFGGGGGASSYTDPAATGVAHSQGYKSGNGQVIITPAQVIQTFNYTGAIQNFTVPAGVTSVSIEARGAQGGNTGGLGAKMAGTFTVVPGAVLKVLVGQQGGIANNTQVGGGGGSFVTTSANVPLCVAGGGGGKSNSPGQTPGMNANITTNGNNGYSALNGLGNPSDQYFGIGGINGNGATNGAPALGQPHAGNGGGFNTDGAVGQCGGPGLSFLNGGAGGGGCSGGPGGFGGGGSGGNSGGGGGGGYSGGGGSYHNPTNGGGGGSFNSGANQSNSVGFQSGNGQVILTYVAGGGAATTTQTAGLASGATFPVGTTTNTFQVSDGLGNTASCSFTVTVVDGEVPTIICPGNITVNNAAGMCDAVVTFNAPVGTDNCSATTVQTAGLPSGSTFPVGVTTQTYTATDAAGNASSCSFTVTVVDNELPTIGCPANVATCNPLVTGIAPTSTNDNCVGTTVAYALTGATTGNGNTDASGTTFNVGTTSVMYTVTDAAGNANNCAFNVVIHPTPVVVLSAFANDTICQGDAAVTLPNATPAGGTFSGAGVVGGNFNPATAGTGNHYVVYSSTNVEGCTDIDSTMITVVVCAGIKDGSNGSSIVVYPNPTSGMVTITLGSMSKSVEVTVTELNGALVKSEKYSNSKNVRMDISNLSDGMYFVTVKADNELKQVKIVKN